MSRGDQKTPPEGNKRPTPSSPLAALHPTRSRERHDPALDTQLDQRTRDLLILRTIARVERIDTESEQTVHYLELHGARIGGVEQAVQKLIASHDALRAVLTEIKELLQPLVEHPPGTEMDL